jgi:hypothetical protein
LIRIAAAALARFRLSSLCNYHYTRDINRGCNIGLFHPVVFSGTDPKQQMLWLSFETRGHIRFYRAVPGQERTMEFEMGEFMVDDRLPMPAL